MEIKDQYNCFKTRKNIRSSFWNVSCFASTWYSTQQVHWTQESSKCSPWIGGDVLLIHMAFPCKKVSDWMLITRDGCIHFPSPPRWSEGSWYPLTYVWYAWTVWFSYDPDRFLLITQYKGLEWQNHREMWQLKIICASNVARLNIHVNTISVKCK